MQKELDEFLYENSLYLTQNFKDKLLPWLSQIYNEGWDAGFDSGVEDKETACDESYKEGYSEGASYVLNDLKTIID